MGGMARSGSRSCLRGIGWRKPRACAARYAPAASWCMGAMTAAGCPQGDSPSRSTRVSPSALPITPPRAAASSRSTASPGGNIRAASSISAPAPASSPSPPRRALNASVVASDMDPIAVAVAAENARTNGVQSRVVVVEADGLAHPALRRAKADLLFANILLRPLLDLAPAFSRALRPGGICVLSGLLAPQARQVEARFRDLGFRLEFANPSRWMGHLVASSSQRPTRAIGLIAAGHGLTRRHVSKLRRDQFAGCGAGARDGAQARAQIPQAQRLPRSA